MRLLQYGDLDLRRVKPAFAKAALALLFERIAPAGINGQVDGRQARAEVYSSYKPARKLWARTRNGYYLPNPAMLLRQRDGRRQQWRG